MRKGYILGIALILLCLGVAAYEGIMVVNNIHPVLNMILFGWNCILAGITMGALRMFRTFAKLPTAKLPTAKYTIEFDDGHKEQFDNYEAAIEKFNDELAKMVKDSYKQTCENLIKELDELDESGEITYRPDLSIFD